MCLKQDIPEATKISDKKATFSHIWLNGEIGILKYTAFDIIITPFNIG